MQVFMIGVTGGVGSMVARELSARGDAVAGLVRTASQRDSLAGLGVRGEIGDLTSVTAEQLAAMIGTADSIVFTAGAGGGGREATTAIDGDGVVKAIAAAQLTGRRIRFVLVSVFPEAWRERNLGEGFDHYIHVKKTADIALTRSGLDWVILRPSALHDGPGEGSVALGLAEIHGDIARADVAATLVEILHEQRISQEILELTAGDTPIPQAVAGVIRPGRNRPPAAGQTASSNTMI